MGRHFSALVVAEESRLVTLTRSTCISPCGSGDGLD